ncbi:ubiquinone/menaquinone biosynthesis methyltransferase [bacterium]|nr:ubiquinone/menaquinone biosynthesis methyltransferase [bacterium]
MSPRVVGPEVRAMFGSIAGRYDVANSFLSMGIHKWWRRVLASHWRDLPRDRPVLDLCSGTGDVLFDLEKHFDSALGADFCLPMLQRGRERRPSSHFLQADALQLPFQSASFQLVTVSFGIRNVESLERGLSEIYRVLEPEGRVLILEFGQPKNVLWRALFNWYSQYVMPLLGGVLTGNRAAYEYLPETSRLFPCGGDFVTILQRAGFGDVHYSSLSGGIAYLYRAKRPGKV